MLAPPGPSASRSPSAALSPGSRPIHAPAARIVQRSARSRRSPSGHQRRGISLVADEVHSSSLVVHSRKERAVGVAAALGAMEGMQVHGGVAEGQLVVTLETASEGEIVERMNVVQLLDGVLAATLV